MRNTNKLKSDKMLKNGGSLGGGDPLVPHKSLGSEQRPKAKSSHVRSLEPGEPYPLTVPKRYLDGSGYTRLRWKVGAREYVETYEKDSDGNILRSRPMVAKRTDKDEAVRLYLTGLSTIEVGERINCDSSAVSRALAEAGVPARKQVAPSFDAEEAIRRFQNGEGSATIAKSMGVGQARIKEVLVKAGLTVKAGRKPGQFKTTTNKLRGAYQKEFMEMRPEILERDREMCTARLSPNCKIYGRHVHHRKLRSAKGENSRANLVTLCNACHAYIHQNILVGREYGFLVSYSQNPEDVPIQWYWTRNQEEMI